MSLHMPICVAPVLKNNINTLTYYFPERKTLDRFQSLWCQIKRHDFLTGCNKPENEIERKKCKVVFNQVLSKK